MRIAAIIPFRADPATLLWALEGFAAQSLAPDMHLEIRICGDGVAVPRLPVPTMPRITFWAIESPRIGISEAKNILLRNRPADLVLFANGDTRPETDMVRIHADTLLRNPPGTMVLGDSPWEKPAAATVFDALLADTPMVFFYNQLRAGEWYDFRHAWNLNVSVRYGDLERAGFFNPLFRPYGFEDLDVAFRIMGEKSEVYFEPAARSMHRHPTTLEQYLNREELLGLMLPVLAATCPDLFAALHQNRSIDALAEDARTWTAMDLPSHRWTYQRLQEWACLPESTLGAGPDSIRLKHTIYQMHIPLKRFAFRLGLLRGLEMVDDACWQQRNATAMWKQALGI